MVNCYLNVRFWQILQRTNVNRSIIYVYLSKKASPCGRTGWRLVIITRRVSLTRRAPSIHCNPLYSPHIKKRARQEVRLSSILEGWIWVYRVSLCYVSKTPWLPDVTSPRLQIPRTPSNTAVKIDVKSLDSCRHPFPNKTKLHGRAPTHNGRGKLKSKPFHEYPWREYHHAIKSMRAST